MHYFCKTLFAVSLLFVVQGCTPDTATSPVMRNAPSRAPNGISLPQGYKDWRVIAISHRTDNESLRAILGNDIAIAAARSGKTILWPDGSILAKLVWKDTVHEDDWPDATVPGQFIQVEFMVRNTQKYAATGGWGFARWLGDAQKPYGEDETFVQECFACHTPMKDNNFVFTRPVKLP